MMGKATMRIAVKYVEDGRWEVGINTANSGIPLGSIRVSRVGRFVPQRAAGKDHEPSPNIESAAKALARLEVGGVAGVLPVDLPFADGSGP